MAKITALTGREYHLFNYHGAPDAERVIIAMGSVCDTVREVVETLNAAGRRWGCSASISIGRSRWRTFSRNCPPACSVLPSLTVPKSGAQAEPLCLDVKNAFYQRDDAPLIVGGRYALGGKDVLPNDIAAVFDNLRQPLPKDGFTTVLSMMSLLPRCPPGRNRWRSPMPGSPPVNSGDGLGRHRRGEQKRHQDHRR